MPLVELIMRSTPRSKAQYTKVSTTQMLRQGITATLTCMMTVLGRFTAAKSTNPPHWLHVRVPCSRLGTVPALIGQSRLIATMLIQ